MFSIPKRRLLTLLVVGLLVLGAGCAGLSASDSTESPTATATSTTASDGHDHTHGGEETETMAATMNGTATGKLSVVVATEELALPSRDEAGDGFDMADDPHTWQASSSMTLATALSRFDVTATEDTLSVDGETYRTSTDGTTISYRVNGQSVDPETATLEDGDEVWVTVETAAMNASVPGTYIYNDQQHIHGDMTVTVEGDAVDFSQSRYQSNDRYFHFEGGVGEYWHSHSANLTLAYALDSLQGVEYTEDSLMVDGTTYEENNSGTTVTYEVNGESVTPADYHLKDGDDVTITVD